MRDSDGDFNPKPKSPTKNDAPPPKKATSPRKGAKAQHDAVDEGIAATPNDTFLQAQAENKDSTYDSSPERLGAENTPRQASARKNAARGTRSNRVFVGPSSASFEAEQATEAALAVGSAARSQVVVLKVVPDRLRAIVEGRSASKRTLEVTLNIPPERLRRLQEELVEGEAVSDPDYQPEEPLKGEAAGMAPLKEKNPHDVLDGRFPLERCKLAAA